jgi:signal transduction histidine kinase
MCARSTTAIPGGFTLRREGGDHVAYLTHGAVVAPKSEKHPSLVLLRFEPKHIRNPFILLNQTIQELTNEVNRRRDAEAALRDSERALQERVAEAEEANRLKDYFLATVSHELRTPLNAILGWATLIRSESVDEVRRARGLEVIERNARLQVSLIDELLDVSRIISGKMRLDVQSINPVDAIQPQTQAAMRARDRAFLLTESVEHVRKELFRDTGSRVTHGDLDVRVDPFEHDLDTERRSRSRSPHTRGQKIEREY